MGSRLIIKNANFYENCIEEGDTIVMRKSGWGVSYLNFSTTVNSIQRNRTTVAQTFKLFVYDVTNFVGSQIAITTCHAVISGASYCAFSADLGKLTFNDIPSLDGSQAPSDTGYNVQIGSIENFNVSSTNKVKNTITKTIPSGARYLCLTFMSDGNLAESGVNVTLV